EPVEHAARPAVADNMRNRRVDGSVPAPASLVREWPWIAEAGQDEAMPDLLDRVTIACEPAECADGAGGPEEAVGVAELRLRQERARELGEDGDAREIVVGKGGMARVRRENDLVGRRAFDETVHGSGCA